MPIELLMPALSPTMTEGNLARWLKKEGEKISAGEVIAEIETDKATMEVEAVDEGTLGRIVVAEGAENVPVNAVIGLLLEEGEDPAALEGFQGDAVAPAAAAPPPEAPAAAAPAPEPKPSSGNGVDTGRIMASPLAKRMAAQAGLALAGLEGSGPHGRIVKADVERALKGGAAAVAPVAEAPAPRIEAPAPQPAPPAGGYAELPSCCIRAAGLP
jgi:pyruvate dehydrogenase E2 component (dihydrolipoamide acetyltransferase)